MVWATDAKVGGTSVPLASGALSGTWTRETTFPRGDWRSSVFTCEALERTLRYVDDLRFLEAAGGSMAEAAIRFAFSDLAVSSAIPGTRNAAQTETIQRAWQAGPLPEETLQRLYSLWETEFSRHIETSIGGASEV